MTRKIFALAASMAMLVAISGNASARSAGSHTRHWTMAAGPSDQQMRQAFNAVYPVIVTQMAEPNAHRYHGGPKSNY